MNFLYPILIQRRKYLPVRKKVDSSLKKKKILMVLNGKYLTSRHEHRTVLGKPSTEDVVGMEGQRSILLAFWVRKESLGDVLLGSWSE